MFEVFALQGRHVAVVGVKFGVACRLIHAKFHSAYFCSAAECYMIRHLPG